MSVSEILPMNIHSSFFDVMAKQLFKDVKSVRDIVSLLNENKTLEMKEQKIPSKYANVSSEHKQGCCDHKFKRSSLGYKKDDFCNNPVKEDGKCSSHSSSKEKEEKVLSPDYIYDKGIIISKADGALLSDSEKHSLLDSSCRVLCNGTSKKGEACKKAVGIEGKDELLCPVHFRAKHSQKPSKDKASKENKKEDTKENTKEQPSKPDVASDTDGDSSANDSDSDDDVSNVITLSKDALKTLASVAPIASKKPSPNK